VQTPELRPLHRCPVSRTPDTLDPLIPGLIPDRVYALKMDTAGFLEAVTLTIAYDPSLIPSGVEPTEMKIYLVENGTAEEVASSSTDIDAQVVTGTVLGPGNIVSGAAKGDGGSARAAVFDGDELVDVATFGIGRVRNEVLEPGSTTSYTTRSVLTVNTCNIGPTPPLETQSVSISEDGQTITFLGISGPWYGSSGEGTMQQTIPIDVANDCWGTQTLSFVITFSDSNHFTATYHIDNVYTSGCETDDCEWEFEMTGERGE